MIKPAKEKTRFGVIYFGSTAAAMNEALAALETEGMHLDMMRLRAFPFSEAVSEFINAHDQVFLVEQNRDAQMRMLLVNECGIDPARFISVLHYDGTPITARFIIAGHRRAHDHEIEGSRGMTYIVKPKLRHPGTAVNKLGFTHRDYEGTVSTLCAGCGHDFDFRPPSSRPVSSWRSSRTGSPNCRASAVRPRRPTISWARATASIPCMAACRRS